MAAVVELRLVPAEPSRPARDLPRLRELRGAAGLTQQQVADRAGVDRVTVRRWEQGKEQIPDEHLSILSEMFGVTAVFLAGAPLTDDGSVDPRSEWAESDWASQADVLRDVAQALTEATLRLPRGSEWHWAFLGIRRHVLRSIEETWNIGGGA